MKRIFFFFLFLFLISNTTPVKAAPDYLDIEYKKVNYTQKNGFTVACYYSLVSKEYRPNLLVANNYTPEFLQAQPETIDTSKLEKPTDMAKKVNATLLTNLGRGGKKQPMVVDGIQMITSELKTNNEIVYMTTDGNIQVMDIATTTNQDLMSKNPVWADYIFFTIAKNNKYIDPKGRASYEQISLRHPRTFFGQTTDGYYIVGVCEGRNDGITSNYDYENKKVKKESKYGLTLSEIVDFVKTEITGPRSKTIKILVNADGGGSSAFVYKGKRINKMPASEEERGRYTGIYWSKYSDITYITNGGSGCGTANVNSVDAFNAAASSRHKIRKNGLLWGELCTPTPKQGYTFTGWNTKKDGTGKTISKNITVTSSLFVYAQYKLKTFTVTLDSQSATNTGTAKVTATYTTAMPKATAPTKTGYIFGGYYTGKNGTGTQYYKADMSSAKKWDKLANTTLYAMWEKKKDYKINHYRIDYTKKYIDKIEVGTNQTQYKKNFVLPANYSIKIDLGSNKNISTGSITQIYYGTKKESSYINIVRGDIDGDGEISSGDLLKAKKHLEKIITLKNEYLLAADVNDDININSGDLLNLRLYLIHKK